MFVATLDSEFIAVPVPGCTRSFFSGLKMGDDPWPATGPFDTLMKFPGPAQSFFFQFEKFPVMARDSPFRRNKTWTRFFVLIEEVLGKLRNLMNMLICCSGVQDIKQHPRPF